MHYKCNYYYNYIRGKLAIANIMRYFHLLNHKANLSHPKHIYKLIYITKVAAFDKNIITKYKSRKFAVNACTELTLELLSKS